MSAPTPRAVRLLAALVPAALLPAVVGAHLWPAWAVGVSVALTALLADALLAAPGARLHLAAEAPAVLSVGQTRRLLLHVDLDWPLATRGEATLDLDARFEHAQPQALALAAGRRTPVAFDLRALRRGQLVVEAAWLRWRGPLGLVQRVRRFALARELAVVPDLRPVRDAALRFGAVRSARVGLKVERFVGEGTEFEALKDYVPGLDQRALDWKASARRRRLVVREYRAERNHQVLTVFDTGRLMSEPLGGLARLDHAIHSGLLLAWVALRSGDRVGLAAFDERPRCYVAPRGGPATFAALQRESARLAYTQSETNFALGLLEPARRLTRRSLVVVMTDFVDTVAAELMLDHLGRLARRHLVLFVALSDAALRAWADVRPRQVEDLGRAVVSRGLLHEREGVLLKLRRLGVHCLEAEPGALSTRLVNRYLELRRRELV